MDDTEAKQEWMTLRPNRKVLRARIVKRYLSGECPMYDKELCTTNRLSVLCLRSAHIEI